MCVFIGQDKEVAFDYAVWLSLGTVFSASSGGGITSFEKGASSCAVDAEVEARAWDGSGKAVVRSLSGWGYAWLMDDRFLDSEVEGSGVFMQVDWRLGIGLFGTDVVRRSGKT